MSIGIFFRDYSVLFLIHAYVLYIVGSHIRPLMRKLYIHIHNTTLSYIKSATVCNSYDFEFKTQIKNALQLEKLRRYFIIGKYVIGLTHKNSVSHIPFTFSNKYILWTK